MHFFFFFIYPHAERNWFSVCIKLNKKSIRKLAFLQSFNLFYAYKISLGDILIVEVREEQEEKCYDEWCSMTIRKQVIVLLLPNTDGQHTTASAAEKKKRVTYKTKLVSEQVFLYINIYRMETMTYRSAEGLVSVDSSPCTLKCKSLSMFDRIVLSPIAKNEQTISHEHNDKRKKLFSETQTWISLPFNVQ